MSQLANVIEMPRNNTAEQAITIVIPFCSVAHTKRVLVQLEAANQLSQAMLARAAEYGDEQALAAVREVYRAITGLVV
jgi:hypothetical protein